MYPCEKCNWIMFTFEFIVVVLLFLRIVSKLTAAVSKSNTCLAGKTVLITGGNSGIGYQTALALAGRGARIIIADKDDATETINTIAAETNNKNVVYKYLDLGSFATIRRFAKEINEEEDRLDIVINNAGIGGAADKITKDGIPLTMQVNYLGPFLLTHLLLDLLKKSTPSRIIFVSSLLAFTNNLSPKRLKEAVKGDSFIAHMLNYGNTKLLNIISSNIFAKSLSESLVTCNAVHPGVVNTPIYSRATISGKLKQSIYKILLPIVGKSPWEGAQTQIDCALSKKLEKVTGKLFVDCRQFPIPLKARDSKFCLEMWRMSEEIVELRTNEKLIVN